MSYVTSPVQLIAAARTFAIAAHSAVDQRRKYTGEPYWTHPQHVAERAEQLRMSHYAVAAAWLHDVVEDTGVTHELILCMFGSTVHSYVQSLTEDPMPDRQTRKLWYSHKLATAEAEVQDLKLIDCLHNLKSVIQHDPDFARVYRAEMQRLLPMLTKARYELVNEVGMLLLLQSETQFSL